jgi:hypothetical protein
VCNKIWGWLNGRGLEAVLKDLIYDVRLTIYDCGNSQEKDYQLFACLENRKSLIVTRKLELMIQPKILSRPKYSGRGG